MESALIRKKLMILGASAPQVNLLNAAKEMGYYVIVCDSRPEMAGSKMADRYYQADFMDREAIYNAAVEEKIDGIISNSEPAMLNVAWLSQKLGLPGNTEESVARLLSKSEFRELQKKAGVFSPDHFVANDIDEVISIAKNMTYPIIIKPAKSSGTRGTTNLPVFDELNVRNAFDECKEFSRDGQVELEKYVEMQSLTVNDADIFVLGDEIIWDGWLWENRSKDTPMLPMTEVFPLNLPDSQMQAIKEDVSKIIRASGVRHGEYNVETYYTKDGEVFVIEINPRQAGNFIPQLIEQHTGVSLTKLLVSTAVGDMRYYDELKNFKRQNNYVTLQVVFGKKDGVYDGLYIDPEIRPYVKWVEQAARPGDWIARGTNAADAVAFVDMEFDDYDTQHRYTDDIERYIYAVMRE